MAAACSHCLLSSLCCFCFVYYVASIFLSASSPVYLHFMSYLPGLLFSDSSPVNSLLCSLYYRNMCFCPYTDLLLLTSFKPYCLRWPKGGRMRYVGGGVKGSSKESVFVKIWVYVIFVEQSVTFACCSVCALCYSASSSKCPTFLKECVCWRRLDFSESCHDNVCLHLKLESTGEWGWSNIYVPVLVHVCLTAQVVSTPLDERSTSF